MAFALSFRVTIIEETAQPAALETPSAVGNRSYLH